MDNKLENLKAAMEDRAFVERIIAMEEPEEVQKAFSEKNVDLSLEEINYIAEQVMNGNVEELDEKQLESVAGGVDPFTCACAVITIVKVGCDIMTEVNKSRKAAGKKTIW